MKGTFSGGTQFCDTIHDFKTWEPAVGIRCLILIEKLIKQDTIGMVSNSDYMLTLNKIYSDISKRKQTS